MSVNKVLLLTMLEPLKHLLMGSPISFSEFNGKYNCGISSATQYKEVIEMRNIKDEICDIVVSNPHGWSAILKCRNEYLEFLDEQYPQFKDNFFKLSTKIYWLMNGIVDFPICPTCGRHYGQHMNVDARGYPGHCSCRCTQLDKKVRQKNFETNMKLYGVSNGAASEQSREKYRKHCQDKWGVDNAFQAKEIKDKIAKVNIERYGVENPMQNKDIRLKANETLKVRYGVDAPCRLVKSFNRSNGEIELFEFIKGLFSDADVIPSDKNAIYPFELDIWIPKYRIGIEYDGDYWHSIPEMVERDNVKNQMCSRKSIQLYRVLESSWKGDKNEVKMFFEQLKRGIKENE